MSEKYKYKQIEQYVYERIQNGEFAVNTLLPTQAWFCEQFHVSRATVHSAFQKMIENGLVESIQGSGAYVRMPELNHQNIDLTSFSEQYTDMGYHVSTKLLFYAKKPISEFQNKDLAKKLRALPDDTVHYFERLRFGNGVPFAVQYTYILERIVPTLPLPNLENSLYSYMENHLKLSIADGSNALMAILPPAEIAERLEIPPSQPVIYLSHTSRLNNGITFEYVDGYTKYDKFSLSYINKREKQK